MKINKLKNFAKNIRKNIIFTAFKAGSKSAHIGGALSAADIIVVLYSGIMKIKKTKILDENRDRFILSKGHACLALYSALVEKKLSLPAYDQCLKASHVFNILDARGVISVVQRASYIGRIRDITKGVAEIWLSSQTE